MKFWMWLYHISSRPVKKSTFYKRIFSSTLFQSLLNSLSSTAWQFEWVGAGIHQIKMHIQIHFNVQCTLKSLPLKLYGLALQCNFIIKTFYHNRITNSNSFISFFFNDQLVLELQTSNYIYFCFINGAMGK